MRQRSGRSRGTAGVAVFLPSLAGGGAERVTLALCDGLARAGWPVTLLVGSATGPLTDQVPASVTLVDLGSRRVLTAAIGLARHLRRSRPAVLISAISHANIIAAVAARLTRPRCPVVVMHHNTTSISTRNTGKRLDRVLPLLCGLAYPLADRVVAVSHGVAADLAASSHLDPQRITVIANPIDYTTIRERARQPVDPALLPEGDEPLVVAAGRFEPQKGFDVLLRAAAAAQQPWRLLILGDGPLRTDMQALARSLDIEKRVSMPGFVGDPYPCFEAASVFALSSRFEGLPTVLLESLAFNLRIVSTDCPSGPREILGDVAGAELVPVEDSNTLADALDRAVGAGELTVAREQWRRYDTEHVMSQIGALVGALVGAVAGADPSPMAPSAVPEPT